MLCGYIYIYMYVCVYKATRVCCGLHKASVGDVCVARAT